MEPFALASISSIPVLIIESANDPLIDKNVREQLKAAFPNASVFTFPAAGHFPYLNEAKKYNELLRDFFLGKEEQSNI